ncbi:hypothetical protein SKAU_G00315210 [Synaphobranchus kaupii]|uniref:Uncharacterized protein n=1 Tax=Synaphobranchus kaupii TaxID=118154 RepID=A0A9Q1ESK3_SYNKA|nr:hypothetical protein SKAU_G00315210 [Synaphobranchus kaupii]
MASGSLEKVKVKDALSDAVPMPHILRVAAGKISGDSHLEALSPQQLQPLDYLGRRGCRRINCLSIPLSFDRH